MLEVYKVKPGYRCLIELASRDINWRAEPEGYGVRITAGQNMIYRRILITVTVHALRRVINLNVSEF